MPLFFESRHASLLVEAFVLKWGARPPYHSMRRADYPYCIYFFRSRSACDRIRAGLWQPSFESHLALTSVGKG